MGLINNKMVRISVLVKKEVVVEWNLTQLPLFLLCFLHYFVYCKFFFIDDKDINLELKSNLKAFSIVLNTSS